MSHKTGEVAWQWRQTKDCTKPSTQWSLCNTDIFSYAACKESKVCTPSVFTVSCSSEPFFFAAVHLHLFICQMFFIQSTWQMRHQTRPLMTNGLAQLHPQWLSGDPGIRALFLSFNIYLILAIALCHYCIARTSPLYKLSHLLISSLYIFL